MRQHASTVHSETPERNAEMMKQLTMLHNSLSHRAAAMQVDAGMVVKDDSAAAAAVPATPKKPRSPSSPNKRAAKKPTFQVQPPSPARTPDHHQQPVTQQYYQYTPQQQYVPQTYYSTPTQAPTTPTMQQSPQSPFTPPSLPARRRVARPAPLAHVPGYYDAPLGYERSLPPINNMLPGQQQPQRTPTSGSEELWYAISSGSPASPVRAYAQPQPQPSTSYSTAYGSYSTFAPASAPTTTPTSLAGSPYIYEQSSTPRYIASYPVRADNAPIDERSYTTSAPHAFEYVPPLVDERQHQYQYAQWDDALPQQHQQPQQRAGVPRVILSESDERSTRTPPPGYEPAARLASASPAPSVLQQQQQAHMLGSPSSSPALRGSPAQSSPHAQLLQQQRPAVAANSWMPMERIEEVPASSTLAPGAATHLRKRAREDDDLAAVEHASKRFVVV